MTHGAPKIAVEKELKCKSCKFNSGLVTTEQNFNIINPSYMAKIGYKCCRDEVVYHRSLVTEV